MFVNNVRHVNPATVYDALLLVPAWLFFVLHAVDFKCKVLL